MAFWNWNFLLGCTVIESKQNSCKWKASQLRDALVFLWEFLSPLLFIPVLQWCTPTTFLEWTEIIIKEYLYLCVLLPMHTQTLKLKIRRQWAWLHSSRLLCTVVDLRPPPFAPRSRPPELSCWRWKTERAIFRKKVNRRWSHNARQLGASKGHVTFQSNH